MAGSDRAGEALIERLTARRPEIEQGILTRVYAIAEPSETADPEYVEGLKAALRGSLTYGLATVELGEERPPPLPPALLIQARLAARNGVSLDTVLRRYFAGYTLFGDFILQEVEADPHFHGAALHRLLQAQAVQFDRLVAAVSAEHTRERENRFSSHEERQAERVKRLLDGELLDTSELAYELDAHHLGVVAADPKGVEAIRRVGQALDRRLLLVRRSRGTVWAWLGGRRRLDPDHFRSLVSSALPTQVSVAIGEPAQGLAGWRLTHRQASAALPIALRGSRRLVCYADVALLASMLQDDVLTTSLRRIFLAPLERERDGGEVARQTLRAYFAAERNVSSAASALGVNRNTVASRLRTIEVAVGRPLTSCTAELETALHLAELHEASTVPSS